MPRKTNPPLPSASTGGSSIIELACGPTIDEGTPYDWIKYYPMQDRRHACFLEPGKVCCQVVCANGYRCQFPASYEIRWSEMASGYGPDNVRHVQGRMYFPKSFKEIPDGIFVCGFHNSKIRSWGKLAKDAAKAGGRMALDAGISWIGGKGQEYAINAVAAHFGSMPRRGSATRGRRIYRRRRGVKI